MLPRTLLSTTSSAPVSSWTTAATSRRSSSRIGRARPAIRSRPHRPTWTLGALSVAELGVSSASGLLISQRGRSAAGASSASPGPLKRAV